MLDKNKLSKNILDDLASASTTIANKEFNLFSPEKISETFETNIENIRNVDYEKVKNTGIEVIIKSVSKEVTNHINEDMTLNDLSDVTINEPVNDIIYGFKYINGDYYLTEINDETIYITTSSSVVTAAPVIPTHNHGLGQSNYIVKFLDGFRGTITNSSLREDNNTVFTNLSFNVGGGLRVSTLETSTNNSDMVIVVNSDGNFLKKSFELFGYQPYDEDLTSISNLSGTSGLLQKVSENNWILNTNNYLTENQNITLTGIISGSGTTNIITSIADNTLSIAKTSGLQTALDSKMYTSAYPDIAAIEVLTGNSGLLRKNNINTWSLDTSTYITGNQTITLSGIISGSGTTSIVTSIANNALSIAKTSGLQTALDSKMTSANYLDLAAIEVLTGTSGLLRKTNINTWSLDTSTYSKMNGLTSDYIPYWNGTYLVNSMLNQNTNKIGLGIGNPLSLLHLSTSGTSDIQLQFSNLITGNGKEYEGLTIGLRGGIGFIRSRYEGLNFLANLSVIADDATIMSIRDNQVNIGYANPYQSYSSINLNSSEIYLNDLTPNTGLYIDSNKIIRSTSATLYHGCTSGYIPKATSTSGWTNSPIYINDYGNILIGTSANFVNSTSVWRTLQIGGNCTINAFPFKYNNGGIYYANNAYNGEYGWTTMVSGSASLLLQAGNYFRWFIDNNVNGPYFNTTIATLDNNYFSVGENKTGSSTTPYYINLGNSCATSGNISSQSKIFLSGNSFAFGVSLNSLNYHSNTNHDFYSHGSLVARLNNSGLNITSLSGNYIPYKTSAGYLSNSPIFANDSNIAVGKTSLENWGSLIKAIQFGGSGAIWGSWSTGISHTYLTNNVYYDESNTISIYSGICSEYMQAVNGNHYWTCDSISAANTIFIPTIRMTLHSSGVLSINNLAGTGNRAVYSDSNGALTNSSSDRTMKINIENIKYGLETCLNLRPVIYNWKEDLQERLGSQKEIGLIAQEVEELVPEVIGTNSDGTKSIDYPKLVSILIKAIQELKNEVDLLK